MISFWSSLFRSSYTPWIDNLRPQRYMEFYGQWSQEEGVLSISESTREPVVIQEKGPDVPTCAQIFDSVKNVIDSRFMGMPYHADGIFWVSGG